ncbi:MAG: hypothetical protein D6797_09675 [Bdellovibrio sp.]|nr:MAG: hypothetical protein D6797_09675 [Bdellovibrio sp.]
MTQKTDSPPSVISLEYRDSVKQFYYLVIGILILSELVILRLNLPKVVGEDWWLALVKLLLASSVPVTMFGRLYIFFRPAIFSTYKLLDDRLLICFKRKERELMFSQVKEIKLTWLPPRFFGGFIVVMKSGKKFLFLSILKDSHLIFEAITRQQRDLLSEEKKRKYLKQSAHVEVSWGRLLQKLTNWKMILLKWVTLPSGFAAIFSYLMPQRSFGYFFIVFLIIALFVSAVLNSFEEAQILDYLAEEESREEDREAFFSKIENIFLMLFFALNLLIFIASVYFLAF